MRFPIQYQFMLPVLAVAIVSLAAVSAVNSQMATRRTTERIEDQLRGVLGVLSQSSYPLTDAVLSQMGGLANAEFILANAQGRRVASSGKLSVQDLEPLELAVHPVDEFALEDGVTALGSTYLHAAVWLERPAAHEPPRVLHVLFAKSDYNAAWRAAFAPPLVVGLVTVVALAAATHLVARRLSAVLAGLGEDVQRLAGGDYTQAPLPPCDDETRDLAHSIRLTAERLVEYEDEIRQGEKLRAVSMLGAGLAHELRNAATGCRLAVDLHAESCSCHEPEDSLGIARRQLALMESRLQQLLALGQSDSPAAEQEVDFASLITECVELLSPAARHARVELNWHAPAEPVTLLADPDSLQQAVMNLLLNALEAAAKSQAEGIRTGLVQARLQARGEVWELQIDDSGEGLADGLSSGVFDPFVTTKQEGVGLGLVVVKRVVESLGGDISWRRANGNTRFSIRIPSTAEAACV